MRPIVLDAVADNTLLWTQIAVIVALFLGVVGIYTNRLFPRLTEAEHIDSIQSFVDLLLKKSHDTIQALSDECKSVASQLAVERVDREAAD